MQSIIRQVGKLSPIAAVLLGLISSVTSFSQALPCSYIKLTPAGSGTINNRPSLRFGSQILQGNNALSQAFIGPDDGQSTVIPMPAQIPVGSSWMATAFARVTDLVVQLRFWGYGYTTLAATIILELSSDFAFDNGTQRTKISVRAPTMLEGNMSGVDAAIVNFHRVGAPNNCSVTQSRAVCTVKPDAFRNGDPAINKLESTFINANLEAATKVANELEVSPAEILGLSALESGWGQGDFVKEGGNAFFSQYYEKGDKCDSHGPVPHHNVAMAQFPDYLASAECFAELHGALIRGIKDAAIFAKKLQDAGLYGIIPDHNEDRKKRKKIPDPKFVPDTASAINKLANKLECKSE